MHNIKFEHGSDLQFDNKSLIHPIQKRFIRLVIVDSLHFSDSMETEEKPGSVLVGKTPEVVSVFFEAEVTI